MVSSGGFSGSFSGVSANPCKTIWGKNLTSKNCFDVQIFLTSKAFLTSNLCWRQKCFWRQTCLAVKHVLTSNAFSTSNLLTSNFLTSNKLLTSIFFWRQAIADVKKNIDVKELLTSKTSTYFCWRPKLRDVKKVVDVKKSFDVKQIADVKKLLTSKNCWRQKVFDVKNVFEVNNFFDVKSFFWRQQLFWRQRNLDLKNIFDVKLLLTSKKTLDVRKTLDAKNLASTICWTSKAFSKDWWGPLFKFARPGGVAHGLLSKLKSDSESYFSKFEIWKQDPAKFEIKKFKNWKISKFNVLKVWLLLNTKTKYIWTFCFFLLGLQGGPGSAHLPAFSGSATREEWSAHQSSIAWRCLFCFFVRVVLVFLLNLGCSNLCYWIFKRMF